MKKSFKLAIAAFASLLTLGGVSSTTFVDPWPVPFPHRGPEQGGTPHRGPRLHPHQRGRPRDRRRRDGDHHRDDHHRIHDDRTQPLHPGRPRHGTSCSRAISQARRMVPSPPRTRTKSTASSPPGPTGSTPWARSMSFFHCRASEDMWTEALKPSLALIMPIDSPRLPVEPTATE